MCLPYLCIVVYSRCGFGMGKNSLPMKKHNIFLVWTGVMITVADFTVYQIINEKKQYLDSRPGYVLLWTFCVGLIGYWAWKKYQVKWPSNLWMLAYTAYLSIFFPILFVHRFLYPMPIAVINFFNSIRNFPNGPMPLLILYFLVKYFSRKDCATNSGNSNVV